MFFNFQLNAQQYPFRNYTTNEGLSTNKIITIHQKSNKQLWLGTTEGINIYDGNSFQSANQYFKLPNRNVYDIAEINGKTYVGTNGGLCVYDGKDTSVFKTQHGLNHNRVYKTFKDRDGIIWIATAKGAHILKNNKITNVDIHPVINNEPIYNIYEDESGALWFCSITSGVIKYFKNEAKQYLNLYPPLSFVGGALQVNDSTIWFTSRLGLFAMINDSIQEVNTGASEGTSFYDIMKNEKGDIWLGSTSGAYVYRNGSFQNFTTEHGLIHDEIFKIFEDNENSMWFSSTEKGISQLINEKFILSDESNIKFKEVTGIIPKSDTLLYIASKQGLVLYNRFNGHIDTLNVPKVEYYNGYYEHETKQLFVGSNNDIIVVNEDKSYDIIRHFHREGNLRKCWAIQKDNNAKLWFGTSGGIGHIKDSLISFYKSDGNYHDFVLDIQKTKDGTLYFATEFGLTYLKNGKLTNYSKEHNFHRARIRQVEEGPAGNLWLAGEKGLFKGNGQEQFEKIEYEHIRDEPIQSLKFDKNGQLWAGIRTGVLRINFSSETPQIRYFSNFEGFQGKECNISAIYASSDGQMIFGTESGLVTYRPQFEIDQKITPKVELKINVEGLESLKEYSDTIDVKGHPVNLELPTNNNHLDFHFKINSLLFGKGIQFEYKLEGFDNSWKTAKNDSKIEYSELSYGTYNFRIRVVDHPDLFPTDEITIPFSIKKPFYLQGWFIGICFVIVITWIYSYYLIRKNVNLLHKQQKIILSQKSMVEEKNKEIVDSITYAKRIQDAILPNDTLLNESFLDFFVLYKPRDIVSGDFYWVEKIDDEVVFAAADCTGHGVPGAMVSLMCSNLLRKVIIEEKCKDPGLVLDKVSKDLLDRLDGKNEKVADGMDITLCFWNQTTNELRFSGANNPLYLMRNNELIIHKTDKQPIGYFEDRKPFSTHTLQTKKEDQIVLFSDGIIDQFGGPKNKKFSSKRFRNELLTNHSNLMTEQKKDLEKTLNEWQNKEDQIDDICVFSVRF